jgi:hypothetical protein
VGMVLDNSFGDGLVFTCVAVEANAVTARLVDGAVESDTGLIAVSDTGIVLEPAVAVVALTDVTVAVDADTDAVAFIDLDFVTVGAVDVVDVSALVDAVLALNDEVSLALDVFVFSMCAAPALDEDELLPPLDPSSACATAVPLAMAAPMPKVIAPAPSHAYGSMRRFC